MSEAKRKELIEAGRLNEDGSRKPVCPLCRQLIPPERAAEMAAEADAAGDATAEPEAAAAGVANPEEG